MEADAATSTSDVLTWTWGNAKFGTLGTVIQGDGTIRQTRQHPSDEVASDNKWGRIPAANAQQLIQQALDVVREGDETAIAGPSFPLASETLEVRVISSRRERVRRVPVAELSRHPDVAALRAAVVAVRRQVSEGFFSWRSIGGRLTLLLVAVIGMLTWWIIRDWRETSRMEQSAQRLDATVLTREGKTGFDASKFITVRFTPQSGQATEQKIEQYLSAENWELARPGATVRVWHDTPTGHTYLENDIQRWNRDKKWIPLLPIGIAIPILVISLYLSRYRVGVHDDGREYLVLDDYVAGDDRNAFVDRTKYNAIRLLWWLAK